MVIISGVPIFRIFTVIHIVTLTNIIFISEVDAYIVEIFMEFFGMDDVN